MNIAKCMTDLVDAIVLEKLPVEVGVSCSELTANVADAVVLSPNVLLPLVQEPKVQEATAWQTSRANKARQRLEHLKPRADAQPPKKRQKPKPQPPSEDSPWYVHQEWKLQCESLVANRLQAAQKRRETCAANKAAAIALAAAEAAELADDHVDDAIEDGADDMELAPDDKSDVASYLGEDVVEMVEIATGRGASRRTSTGDDGVDGIVIAVPPEGPHFFCCLPLCAAATRTLHVVLYTLLCVSTFTKAVVVVVRFPFDVE